MRTGYVRTLDNGNWEVVERVGRKLVVLSGPDGFAAEGPSGAVRMAGLITGGVDNRREVTFGEKTYEKWDWHD